MVQNMRGDKVKAMQLRKRGGSYRDIEDKLGVPKSTLASWFHHTSWSRSIKERLSEKARRHASLRMRKMALHKNEERRILYGEKKHEAEAQYRTFHKDSFFMAGLMIYWGEGDNKLENGVIRVANSDPIMLRFFYLFLKKYLPEICQKTKAYLILYSDLNERTCLRFWSERIGLPLDRFFKSHYITGRHPTKRLGHGICTVTITSRAYKEKINAWLTMTKEQIARMRV